MPFAFAIIERGGKGYTWICESAAEKDAWYGALADAIKAGTSKDQTRTSDAWILNALPSRPVQERVEVVRRGSTLTKYNKADGKSKLRWVHVGRLPQGDKILWGDQKTRECKSEFAKDATALTTAPSRRRSSSRRLEDGPGRSASIVFKGAARLCGDERRAGLRLVPGARPPAAPVERAAAHRGGAAHEIGRDGLGSASMAHYAGLTPRTGPDAGESDV